MGTGLLADRYLYCAFEIKLKITTAAGAKQNDYV